MTFDVIIVLGAALTEAGEPTPALQKRVAGGIAAYQTGLAPFLLFSGGPTRHPDPEALAMREQARRAGLDEGCLLVEVESVNTWENALYCRRILDEKGFSRILLVSDRAHLPRARACFRAQGLETKGLAAPGRFGNPLWEAAAWIKFLWFSLFPPVARRKN
ncbi:MAG: YdcF family protein [Rhodospirillales bacterium]